MLTLCLLKTFLAKHSGATECISLISLLPLHAFNKFQANYITWKRLQTFSRFKIVLINFCFKTTICNLFCLDFPEKCLRRAENGNCLFFLPALQWRILHKCIILITFSKLFAVLLITEELIKENYQTALPHSNHLVSLFCSAGCHNLPYSFIQRKAPRKEQLYNNFVFKHWKRKKRARAPFLISLSALRKEGGDHQ